MNKSSAPASNLNRIMPGIQCFSWNGKGSKIALCPTNNEIWIFDSANSPDISKWKQIACLKEHFNVITNILSFFS